MSSDLPARDNHVDPAETEPDPMGFWQRGAVVAFTAPQLLGARVRQGKSAASRELILPGFSGTKTPWVIPLNDAGKTQAMTLHDQALWKKLLHVPSLTPAQIRSATMDIAAEGLRGRAAMTFAADHVTTSATAHRRVFFLLLTDLIRRTELPAEAQVPPEQESLTYLRPRIGRAVGRAAKRFNMSVEGVEAALESLAGVFMSLGNAQDAVTGHARQALIDFRAFVKELDQWTAPRRGSPRGVKAEWVLHKAALTLSCAEAAVAELDRVLGDSTLLIRAWHRDKQSVIARAARPEWLLDGWGIVIALWRQSEPSDRAATLWEMAQLVPFLPKEVESWPGFPKDGSAFRTDKIDLSQSFDWRRQRPLDYITRNETLIAGEHAVTLAAEAQKLREAYMVQSTSALTEPDGDHHFGEEALIRISGRASKASDTVLRQVVAVLDAVPSRAMLDPIIEAARPRLKLLRPPRPITFTRILFLPFDGALVPIEKWKPGSGKFPRIILTPLAEALRSAMGPEAEEINANLGGQNFFDLLKVDQVGRRLWAEAARLTPGLRLQEAVPNMGLDAHQCAELLTLATAIWRHAEGIWEAKLAAFSGPSPELVTAALKGPAQEGHFMLRLQSGPEGRPGGSKSSHRPFNAARRRLRRSFAPQVFVQPGHDLDKVAGPVAIVELEGQDLVPGIAAGRGAARQGKEIGPPRHPPARAALHRRGADLGHRDHRKDRAEDVDFLFIDIAVRLDRHVAARQPRAPRGDDDVDRAVGAPAAQAQGDLGAFVPHDLARGEDVARLGDARGERIARAVLGEAARVRNGQERDAHRDEGAGFVDAAHGVRSLCCRARRSAQASALAAGLRSR